MQQQQAQRTVGDALGPQPARPRRATGVGDVGGVHHHLQHHCAARRVERLKERCARHVRRRGHEAVERLHELAVVEHVGHKDNVLDGLACEAVVLHRKVCTRLRAA